ncbi:MAG: hypothetical protein ACLP6G_18195 [Terriglobales bacterium]
MQRVVVILAAFLFCFAFPAQMTAGRHSVKRYLTKETTVDMSKMNRIFIGWVDMHEEGWAAVPQGYSSKQEWADVIGSLNNSHVVASDLNGHTLVFAKNKDDEDAKDCDLYVKFTDVVVDYNNYHLILGIHFIDPKTNQEIGANSCTSVLWQRLGIAWLSERGAQRSGPQAEGRNYRQQVRK